MASTTNKKRLKLALWIGIPVLLVGITLVVVLTGVNTFLKPVIKKTITKVITDGSDSLYIFSLKDYTVGADGRSVVINGLDIHVDSVKYLQMKEAGVLPPLIVSAYVEKAAVSGLSAWELWRHKNIFCNGIVLSGARVNLLQQVKRSDTIKRAAPKSLYELIKPDINDISIRRISINDADVEYKTVLQQTEKKTSWHFGNATIDIDDIKVDATAQADTTKMLYASNLQVALGSFKTTIADGVYDFSTKNTIYDFKKRTASVEELKLIPAISKAAFYKKVGREADLFTISIPAIDIDNFNVAAILVDNSIDAGLVKVQAPDIDIYKDKNAGPDTRNKRGRYPHQLLLKSAGNIRVKKVQIDKGKLVVTQKSIKTQETGSFKFFNVHGNITNVTNHAGDIAVNQWCKADLSAGFMGSNPMNAVFAFDLSAADGHFITDATLASLPPADLNPSFRALARAELETFKLDKLKYHVEGNQDYGVGDMTLAYHDLKLNVLKEDDNGNLKKKGLITLIANALKLYNANPMPGEAERKAINIRNERVYNKNYFGLITQTLLKCVQQIAIKGDNKSLPGLGGGQKPPDKKDSKKDNKKDDKKDNKKDDKKDNKKDDKKDNKKDDKKDNKNG